MTFVWFKESSHPVSGIIFVLMEADAVGDKQAQLIVEMSPEMFGQVLQNPWKHVWGQLFDLIPRHSIFLVTICCGFSPYLTIFRHCFFTDVFGGTVDASGDEIE